MGTAHPIPKKPSLANLLLGKLQHHLAVFLECAQVKILRAHKQLHIAFGLGLGGEEKEERGMRGCFPNFLGRCAGVCAANLGFAIAVDVDEGQRADVVACDGPEAVRALDIKALDGAVAAHQRQRAVHAANLAQRHGIDAIRHLAEEEIAVLVHVVAHQVCRRAHQQHIAPGALHRARHQRCHLWMEGLFDDDDDDDDDVSFKKRR